MNYTKFVISIGVFTLLSASGCGKESSDSVMALESAAEFESYIASFEELSNASGDPIKVTRLKIQFGTLANPRERGICEFSEEMTPTVTISRQIWDQINEAEREELVFHELGHCVLRRKHRAGYNEKGIPVSIMSPYSIRGSIYSENRKEYLAELFQQRNDF